MLMTVYLSATCKNILLPPLDAEMWARNINMRLTRHCVAWRQHSASMAGAYIFCMLLRGNRHSHIIAYTVAILAMYWQEAGATINISAMKQAAHDYPTHLFGIKAFYADGIFG